MKQMTILVLAALTSVGAFAQTPATRPAIGAAVTQPAIDQPFEAKVVEVSGKVSWATTAESGAAGEWHAAQPGDLLPAGTQIRTQIRSKVVLMFGDDTVVLVERATLASIDQFHRSGDTKRIQLGLGHGAIRAGVAETTLRSDMTIETPTATLSKRGTMDFGISYEPISGRFRIYLAQEGLVEALNKLTRQSRLVRPGEYVTQAMIQWIQTATMDRWVPIVDVYGTTDAEQMFEAMMGSGLAVVDPGGGNQIFSLTGHDASQFAASLQQRQQTLSTVLPATLLIRPTGSNVIPRPEGNFGTGLGAGSLTVKPRR
jgi:hypothetical protein